MKRTVALILAVIALTLAFSPEAYCAKKKKSRPKTSQPQTQPVKKSDPHSYYRGLKPEQAEQADNVARKIADAVMSEKSLTSDLQRVKAAAVIVARYCSRCMYGNDPYKYYRSPYGVFVAGIFTCSGATRALGRVLDFMGYKWEHANENQYSHQWCILEMDGRKGFADGQLGAAGYGEY